MARKHQVYTHSGKIKHSNTCFTEISIHSHAAAALVTKNFNRLYKYPVTQQIYNAYKAITKSAFTFKK